MLEIKENHRILQDTGRIWLERIDGKTSGLRVLEDGTYVRQMYVKSCFGFDSGEFVDLANSLMDVLAIGLNECEGMCICVEVLRFSGPNLSNPVYVPDFQISGLLTGAAMKHLSSMRASS